MMRRQWVWTRTYGHMGMDNGYVLCLYGNLMANNFSYNALELELLYNPKDLAWRLDSG